MTIRVVNGPEWDNNAWQRVRDGDRFRFRPGMEPANWPAIDEPAGAVTFDLGAVFDRAGGFTADEDALNAQVLAALITVFAADVPLVALDWQHTSY